MKRLDFYLSVLYISFITLNIEKKKKSNAHSMFFHTILITTIIGIFFIQISTSQFSHNYENSLSQFSLESGPHSRDCTLLIYDAICNNITETCDFSVSECCILTNPIYLLDLDYFPNIPLAIKLISCGGPNTTAQISFFLLDCTNPVNELQPPQINFNPISLGSVGCGSNPLVSIFLPQSINPDISRDIRFAIGCRCAQNNTECAFGCTGTISTTNNCIGPNSTIIESQSDICNCSEVFQFGNPPQYISYRLLACNPAPSPTMDLLVFNGTTPCSGSAMSFLKFDSTAIPTDVQFPCANLDGFPGESIYPPVTHLNLRCCQPRQFCTFGCVASAGFGNCSTVNISSANSCICSEVFTIPTFFGPRNISYQVDSCGTGFISSTIITFFLGNSPCSGPLRFTGNFFATPDGCYPNFAPTNDLFGAYFQFDCCRSHIPPPSPPGPPPSLPPPPPPPPVTPPHPLPPPGVIPCNCSLCYSYRPNTTDCQTQCVQIDLSEFFFDGVCNTYTFPNVPNEGNVTMHFQAVLDGQFGTCAQDPILKIETFTGGICDELHQGAFVLFNLNPPVPHASACKIMNSFPFSENVTLNDIAFEFHNCCPTLPIIGTSCFIAAPPAPPPAPPSPPPQPPPLPLFTCNAITNCTHNISFVHFLANQCFNNAQNITSIGNILEQGSWRMIFCNSTMVVFQVFEEGEGCEANDVAGSSYAVLANHMCLIIPSAPSLNFTTFLDCNCPDEGFEFPFNPPPPICPTDCTRSSVFWVSHNPEQTNINLNFPWPIYTPTTLLCNTGLINCTAIGPCAQASNFNLLTILQIDPQGDAWLVLLKEVIATQLNRNCCPTCLFPPSVEAQYNLALTVIRDNMCTHPIYPLNEPLYSFVVIPALNSLDSYNSGMTNNSCSPGPCPNVCPDDCPFNLTDALIVDSLVEIPICPRDCSRTPTFWATHYNGSSNTNLNATWPILTPTMGICQLIACPPNDCAITDIPPHNDPLILILQSVANGDAWLILAKQYITFRLNAFCATDVTFPTNFFASYITEIEFFLTTYICNPNRPLVINELSGKDSINLALFPHPAFGQMINLSIILDSFNNGTFNSSETLAQCGDSCLYNITKDIFHIVPITPPIPICAGCSRPYEYFKNHHACIDLQKPPIQSLTVSNCTESCPWPIFHSYMKCTGPLNVTLSLLNLRIPTEMTPWCDDALELSEIIHMGQSWLQIMQRPLPTQPLDLRFEIAHNFITAVLNVLNCACDCPVANITDTVACEAIERNITIIDRFFNQQLPHRYCPTRKMITAEILEISLGMKLWSSGLNGGKPCADGEFECHKEPLAVNPMELLNGESVLIHERPDIE